MNLFKAKTINQFRFGAWLADHGVIDEDIFSVDLPGPNTVVICNAAGQYMKINWVNGHAEIEGETSEEKP